MEEYEKLEHAIGEWVGNKNVVACSSGTAALHLALEALKPLQDTQVFQPEYSMIAVPRATVMAGCLPTFIDCDERLLMDLDLLEAHLANVGDWGPVKGDIILVVHVYGRVVDMGRVHQLAERYRLQVIEDMAEVHGIDPHPKTDAACWSFYRNKIVAGEEGGCVVFKDSVHVPLMKSLRSLGFTDTHDYTHIPRGHNYRLSNLHAEAIGRNLRAFLSGPMRWADGASESVYDRRRQIERELDWGCPLRWQMMKRQSPWVYDFRVPGLTSVLQTKMVTTLREKGIQARHGFKPMTSQEEFKTEEIVTKVTGGGETMAEVAAREVIYLPIDPGRYYKEMSGRVWGIILNCDW